MINKSTLNTQIMANDNKINAKHLSDIVCYTFFSVTSEHIAILSFWSL